MLDESRRQRQMPQRSPLAPRGRGIEGEGELPPIVHEVLHSPGQPLDSETRAFFEPRFGQDFGQVRVHADGKAEESSRALNALAFAVGQDIVFGPGQFSPERDDGRRLMAHELTHVVQQSRGWASDRAEERASEAADNIALGMSVAPDMLGSAPVGIQRAGDPEQKKAAGPSPPAKSGISSGTRIDQFVRNSAALTVEQMAKIDAVAWQIALHLGIRVTGIASVKITGHTDTTGTEKYNRSLGLERAQNAKTALLAALEKQHVSADRIAEMAIDSKGELKLAVPTKDNVDEPRNRRVEIEVTIETPPAPQAAEKKPIVLFPPTVTPPVGPATSPTVPSVPTPSREWLKTALETDPLLKKLPDWARDKAIDALKDADELAADKIIDAVPWGEKEKRAAKAAIKALLQIIKGRKFKMPESPPPGAERAPMPEFPKMPGEKIFKLPPIPF